MPNHGSEHEVGRHRHRIRVKQEVGQEHYLGRRGIEEHVTYNPVEGGTAFTIVYDMKVGGLLKLLSPLMEGWMRKETQTSLGNLKAFWKHRLSNNPTASR
jgi:hypothetical protein